MITKIIEASIIDINAETPRGKPCLSKNLQGVINNSAISPEKASGFKISCPRYSSAKTMIKHSSGLTSLAKKEEVEEVLHTLIH